ncbi:hypothetical protein VP466E531_P0015 [Vibrio phage 466E53-1]|nr:hypothetical protein VP466E531_P0015 [Vibrio phage 466E53-1]
MKTPRTNDMTKGELIATLILWCFVIFVTGKAKGWW